MTYLPYIIAAYSVFAIVLAWDGLSPWLKHRRLLRAIRLRAMRDAAKNHAAQGRSTGAGAASAGAAE